MPILWLFLHGNGESWICETKQNEFIGLSTIQIGQSFVQNFGQKFFFGQNFGQSTKIIQHCSYYLKAGDQLSTGSKINRISFKQSIDFKTVC